LIVRAICAAQARSALTAGSFSNFDSAADVDGDGVGVDGGADVDGVAEDDGMLGAGVVDGTELDEPDDPDELHPAKTKATTTSAPTYA
jgi:hypothetical protein